jgi:hypothetical protein
LRDATARDEGNEDPGDRALHVVWDGRTGNAATVEIEGIRGPGN